MVSAAELEAALTALRNGQLVGFPTETVYGLGADATNEQAVRKIFAAKGRPADHPVIIHLPLGAPLEAWASQVPEAARLLAAHFWPGPLTMILPRARHVLDVVTGGQASVGLRVPDHPVAQALLQAFAQHQPSGLAAPSANRFGRISPTQAEHVRAELGAAVAVVLDGGPARVGLESTIVDLTGARPTLLRPGHITAAQLADVLGQPLDAPQRSSPRASGTLPSHYAPATPAQLVPTAELAATVAELNQGQRIAVLARQAAPPSLAAVHWIVAPDDAAAFAHELYALLRQLDALGCDRIVVEAVPDDPAWQAVQDRLSRAAYRTAAAHE